MKLIETNVFECPKCGQFLRSQRRVCPFCGLQLVSTRNIDGGVELFSTVVQGRGETEIQQGKAQKGAGPLAVINAELQNPLAPDVFSSARRTAANGGYTQQSTVEQKKEYTGLMAPLKDDKAYFSSSERKVYGSAPRLDADIHLKKDNEFFHSDVDQEQRKLRESTVNITDDHNAEENPYKKSGLSEEKQIITEHSTEFKAHSITEFRKHRFGAYLYTRVEWMFCTMIALATFLFILDMMYDPVRTTMPIALTYVLEILILTHEFQRTCFRGVASTISVVTIFSSAGLMYFTGHFDIYATVPEIFIILGVIAALNIFSMKQLRAAAAYCENYDAYLKKGSELTELAEPEAIEMYSSKKRKLKKEGGEEESTEEENAEEKSTEKGK